MAYERIVAMHVTNDEGYARYREGMTPILESYGGGFRYDLVVSKALKAEASHPINRLFAIYFADQASSERFFADPEYKKVRAQHFDGAVAAFTQIAAYTR